jgi:RNA polymerase sigma factor (sigma-70 family)
MRVDKIIDLKKSNFLDREELFKRVELAKAGCQESRELVFLSHSRLVVNIANCYWKRCDKNRFSFEDIFSTGYINFGKAIDQFNPDKGMTFTTYVKLWINQSIRVYLKEQATTVVVGTHVKDRLIEKGEMFSIVSIDNSIDGITEHINMIPQTLYDRQDDEHLEKQRRRDLGVLVNRMFESVKHKPKYIELLKTMFGFYDDTCYQLKEAGELVGLDKPKSPYDFYRRKFIGDGCWYHEFKRILEAT